MIEIRPIQTHEIPEAKRMIFTVAQVVFKETIPFEESIAKHTAQGKLGEINDVQRNYFENGGTFLVTIEDGRIIGTGAIRFLEEGVCEVKRLWLAAERHGQGYGYRMMQELIKAARERGYKLMRLETDKFYQARAVRFYQQLGFYEIPRYEGDDPEDMAMELKL